MSTQPPDPESPPHTDKSDWKPPPEFDLIKELNGHAGRLGTLLGLVVAASALSLSNGPIKDALTNFDLSAHAFLYGALIVVGTCIFIAFSAVANALDPATPILQLGQRAGDIDEHEWVKLVIWKQHWTIQAAGFVLSTMLALLLAWLLAYTAINFSWMDPTMSAIAVLVTAGSGLWVMSNAANGVREIRQTPIPAELPNFSTRQTFLRLFLGRGTWAPKAQTPPPTTSERADEESHV